MNYYNYGFPPPSDHFQNPGREWNLPPTVPPHRGLQPSFVARPQMFPNYSRHTNPYFPKNQRKFYPFNGRMFPEEENVPGSSCPVYDRNLQMQNESSYSMHYDRNEIPLIPLPPYNPPCHFHNRQHSQPGLQNFHLQNQSKKSIRPKKCARKAWKIDKQHPEMKPYENKPYDVLNNEAVKIPNPPLPCFQSATIQEQGLRNNMPASYPCGDYNFQLPQEGENTACVTYPEDNLIHEDTNFLDLLTDTGTNIFNNLPLISSTAKGNDLPISDIHPQNVESKHSSEEFGNISNAMDEDDLAVYFLKNLLSTSQADNVALGFPSSSQNNASDFSLTEERNENNMVSANKTEGISFDYFSESSHEKTSNYLETNTGKETGNLQVQENSKTDPSERLSNSSSDYNNEDSLKLKQGDTKLVDGNNCKEARPIYDMEKVLGNKPKKDIADKKFIFHSPVINIILKNQISADNLSGCPNDSLTPFRDTKLADLETKLNSCSTDSMMELLGFFEKWSKSPHFESLSGEKSSEISSVMGLPAIKPGEQCSNLSIMECQSEFSGEKDVNTQLKPVDGISNVDKSSTETYESEFNYLIEENQKLSATENNNYQLNSMNFVPNRERLKEPDFMYSSDLGLEISSNPIEISLSSVTNYNLNEPIDLDDFREFEESFEIDYCTSSVHPSAISQKVVKCSKKKQKNAEKHRSCDQIRLLTSDNDYFPTDDYNMLLLDNIFESDIDDNSMNFEDTPKTKGKKKKKQEKTKNAKRNLASSVGKKLNPKKVKNSNMNETTTKSYHDAETQTLKPESDASVVRCVKKHNAQTQWNSSDMNLQATVNSSNQYENQILKNQYSLCSESCFMSLQSDYKSLNLRDTGSIKNTMKFNNSITDSRKVCDNSSIDSKKVANNTTPGIREVRNAATADPDVNCRSYNLRKNDKSTKTSNNATAKPTAIQRTYQNPSFNMKASYKLRNAKEATQINKQAKIRNIPKSRKNSPENARTSNIIQKKNLMCENEQGSNITGDTCSRKRRRK